jgi:hypothetical protein
MRRANERANERRHMAKKKNRGQQVAAALMLQAMRERGDADVVAFVAAQLADADDPVTKYVGQRLEIVALRLEAEDAAANEREREEGR